MRAPLWVLWALCVIMATVEGQREEEEEEVGEPRERKRGRGREEEEEGEPRERKRGRGRGDRHRGGTRPLIRPRQEVVNALESDPGKRDGTNFLTMHTASHSELAANARSTDFPDLTRSPGFGDSEIARRQMDTIILLLQRLSDRLASLETIQNQRGERLDTVHYRLTRLELQAEERKSIMNDLSNSVKHRMETTDTEMDRVGGFLDDLNTAVKTINLQNTDLKKSVEEIATTQDGQSGAPKLQAAMTSLLGLRSMTQDLKQDISGISQNMSTLSTITKQIGKLHEGMVTKQYLHQNLNEIKMQQMSSSIPIMQPRSRQGQGNKGKALREPEDCWKLLQKGKKKSGVYRIQPHYSTVPFFVYCDMETDGGGWTVIQRREDGSVDFLREWADYKHGFGNLAGEFWLGNEKIYLLTNQHVSKLQVNLADFDQQEANATYSAFALGSELEGYSLKLLGQYTGDAGDSLRYHVGRRFSTIDVDNDAWPEESCARDHKGAWWYKACEASNLNARYLHGPIPADHEYSGIYWYDFRGPRYSLWRSRMMIRRGGNVGEPIFKDLKEIQSNISTPPPANETEPVRPTETPDPRRDGFYNPEHDPYATYDYPYDPYG